MERQNGRETGAKEKEGPNLEDSRTNEPKRRNTEEDQFKGRVIVSPRTIREHVARQIAKGEESTGQKGQGSQARDKTNAGEFPILNSQEKGERRAPVKNREKVLPLKG